MIIKRNNSGNAMLELVLFLPLFLLFLFVAIDGGLAFSEKAAVADALRSGLNMERACAQGKSVLEIGQGYSVQANVANASEVTQCLADEISKIVNRNLGKDPSATADSFKVVVTAYELDVDQNTGAAVAFSPLVSTSNPSGAGNPDLPGNNPIYPYVTEQEYMDQNLPLGGSQASGFAIPLSYIQSVLGGQGSLRFLERSVVLYAEITALARGTNSSFVKSVLGKYYAVEEQQILLLRTQIS